MNKIAFRYAVIVFIITVIWTLLEHLLGYNTTNHEVGKYTRLVTTFVYYAFIALVILRVRKQQGNRLSFGDGVKTGTITCLLYSILVTIWFALYAEVINTQYQPTLLAFEQNKLEAVHATPEQITEKLKQVKLQSGGSFASYVLLFVFMFGFGFIVTLVTSLILKRKKVMA